MILSVPLLQAQQDDMIKIGKLSLNSGQYNEMTPIPFQGGLVFCSDRRVSGIVNNKTFDNDRVYNIFFAERKDTMDYDKTRIFSRDLQTIFNQGPFCFSPDGKKIYYTGDVETGRRALKPGFENRSGIFISEKTTEGWSGPVPFEHNDPLWNLGHPYISNDGQFLFLSSDIPGGQGGSDIYMCRWENGRWSSPENLGPEVNSPRSELYPFFSKTGELYFASDRQGGHGGLDLYSSRMSREGWSSPVLLPEPINSPADDFSFVREQDGGNGYFASNRDRTDDIFMFTSLIIRKDNCGEMVYDTYCYEFLEENASKFDSLPFEHEWDFDDGTKATGTRAEHCFREPGTYLVKLNVIDKITGEVQYSEQTYLLEIKKTEQAFFKAPDTCYVGDAVQLDASQTYLPGWDISEYYWNFDDGSAGKGAIIEKAYMTSGKYNIQLIISANTGDNGNVQQTCVSKYIVVKER